MDKDLKEILRILTHLPMCSTPLNLGDEPEGKVRCAGCGKLIDVQETTAITSPHTYKFGSNTIVDTTCSDCRKNVKDYSYVVCPHTQRVVARMEPHTDPTGFVFEKNKIYHVDTSPNYEKENNPEFKIENKDDGSEQIVLSAVIIEKMLYDKTNKNKILFTPK